MEYILSGFIGGAFTEWVEALLAVIGAASAVAAATPTKKDDTVVGTIARVVDLLALNVGYAKRK
ncbi:hypothetical protein [Parvibaculum sp.]|jgi:hypothetical protein|uniref:hypothetical protein n=1 Tax=Parvibaculum sp. TaxID=2024848 RepID=UPI000C46AD8B|nr:hypothetical protein [Parvibaculum sp.]MAM95324.1 hypothetical protein [Parvibaculum sp.]HCX69265.1 hypothetical protein [Rhodobiaceae bacterium]|tara:strand:+ start:11228 stop:11419 length:192 start_codon:yes stop_codon:yes gene_type:complete